MLDPVSAFSLAANVVQIADTAAELFKELFDYCRNVKEAPARAETLRNEIQHLSALLDSIKKILQSRLASHHLDIGHYSVISAPLDELGKLLGDMQSRVDQSKVAGIWKLRWPYAEKENDRLIAQIERHKKNLALALNIDQT